MFAIFLLMVVVIIYSVCNGAFRQAWRNSKFLDELKQDFNNQDVTDLIDPDK